MSPEKTKQYRIIDPNAQLDFLGYTFKYVSRLSAGRTVIYSRRMRGAGAIALYPNKKRLMMFVNRLKEVFRKSQNLSAVELIGKLNPMIRG